MGQGRYCRAGIRFCGEGRRVWKIFNEALAGLIAAENPSEFLGNSLA